MTTKKTSGAKMIRVSARYAYHIPDPFKQAHPMHDKYGALHFISMEKYLAETKEPNNRWVETKYEKVIRLITMASIPLSFLFIYFILGQSY